MTIETVKVASQMKRHTAVAKKIEAVTLEIHEMACQDLLHAATHGDVSLCRHLYDALGGQMSSQRTATLKAWFVLMSGNQMTAEKGEWKMKKGWDKSKFQLDTAENTPYWTLAGEKEPTKMSIEQILGFIKGLSKKIDKAVEEDRFNGDPEKAKAIVAAVVDLATERAKRLTAQETGAVSNAADLILSKDVAGSDLKSETKQEKAA